MYISNTCAIAKLAHAHCANSLTPRYLILSVGNGVSYSIYLQFSSNGVKPLELLMLELSANSTSGVCGIQSFWLGKTVDHRICPID